MDYKKRRPPRGARPGTLVLADDALVPKMHVMRFDEDTLEEHDVADVAALEPLLVGQGKLLWLDVQGLGDEALLHRLGALFHIHPLALEDVVNAPQRPKSDEYEHNHLLITREFRITDVPEIETEQISVVVGDGWVVTLQESYGDNFDPVRARIRGQQAGIRAAKADYLAYALVDAVIDGYYPVLEGLGDYIEDLDDRVLAQHTATTLADLSTVKHTLATLRRVFWAQREVMNRVVRDESRRISPEVRLFFRDVYDHCQHATEVIENYRDVLASQMNTYLSVVSNKTNDVMRVLTILSSIFIPLTFLAGIYGMNFDFMPELKQRWGYPVVLAVMAGVSVVQLVLFWRLGWIGRSRRGESG